MPTERRPARRARNGGRPVGRLAVALVLTTLLHLAGGHARAQTQGDFRPAWAPNSDGILFQSTRDGNDEIYRFDLETGREVRLTEHPARDAHPSWGCDGRSILFVSDRDRNIYSGRARYQIYRAEADGSDLRRLVESDSADFLPRCSPDGRWIAFLSDRSGGLGLYLMPSEGGEARSLLPAGFTGVPGNPSWSPDSRRVAFDATSDPGYDIFSVGLEEGDVVNHFRTEVAEWYPAWSPSGDEIVVGALVGTRQDGTHTLVRLDLESGVRTPVTRPTPRSEHARDWWPAFSPDGRRLVFASRRDGPWRLFLVSLDGSGERRLTGR